MCISCPICYKDKIQTFCRNILDLCVKVVMLRHFQTLVIVSRFLDMFLGIVSLVKDTQGHTNTLAVLFVFNSAYSLHQVFSMPSVTGIVVVNSLYRNDHDYPSIRQVSLVSQPWSGHNFMAVRRICTADFTLSSTIFTLQ